MSARLGAASFAIHPQTGSQLRVTVVQGPFLPVPAIEGGAVEKLWTSLVYALQDAGCAVTHVSKQHPKQAGVEVDRGVRRIRFRGYNWPSNPLVAKLLDLTYSIRVSRGLPDADILVSNTFFLPMLPIKQSKGILYVSVHRFPRGQFGWYRNAARLQCVSTAVADELKRQSPNLADRVKVIPNFVEISEQEPHKGSNAQTERRLLYVGRIHKEKGLQQLIEAFNRANRMRNRGWSLHVVGPYLETQGGSGSGYRDELRRLAFVLGVPVIWHEPAFDKEVLVEHYRSADLFVYPSFARLGEAFGLAPLEALAHRLPAVTSNLKCFSDFIQTGYNGWTFDLNANDPTYELANTLEHASLAVEAKSPELARNAFETATRFTVNRTVSALLSDFKILVSADENRP